MIDDLVSIIMPVYNAEDYLREAIDSILTQTYPLFELIIINDGSSDNSLEIIKSYRDDRIRVFSFVNGGCSKQRNYGISVAKGKFLAMMDADDISEQTRIEEQYNFLKSHTEIQVVGTNCLHIDEKGKIISIKNYSEFHNEIEFSAPVLCPICPPSMMTYTNILIDCGCYREDFLVAGDYDLILKLLGNAYKFYNLQKPLFRYRIHKSSLSATKLQKQQLNHYECSLYYLNKSYYDSSDRLFYDYRRGLLEYYYGKVSIARKYLFKSLFNNSAPKLRLIRLILSSILGNRLIALLRRKGILSYINRTYLKLFDIDLQKVKTKSNYSN